MAARQADLDAARLLLARIGVSPEELLHGLTPTSRVPTFAIYVPQVSDTVSIGTRRVYSS